MSAPRMLLFGLLTAVACAGQSHRQPSSGPTQRDLITRDEIAASAQSTLDLYQVIRGLRPQFLAPAPGVHRASANAAVAVYVDGMRQTGIESLRTILAANVEEVRYLNPTASQNEFGAAASSGAVIVKLYRPPKDPEHFSLPLL